MKLLLPSLFLLAVLVFSSCYTPIYDAQTLQELPRQEPSPLELSASFELFNWRYDIIRQQECVEDSDGDTSSEDVDYHPIGFDLGNGLFFDLNDNLSLRIDWLLGIDYTQNGDYAKLTYHSSHHRLVRELDLTPDHFQTKIIRPNGRSNSFQTAYTINENEVTCGIRNNRQRPVLEFIEKGVKFRRWLGNYHAIEEVEPGRFHRLRYPKRRVCDTFVLSKDEISLSNNYLIRREVQGDRIQIFRRRISGRLHLLYTIQMTPDEIVVYDANRIGFSVNFKDQGFIYRHSNGTLERYWFRE